MKSTGAKRNVCPGSCVSTGAKFPVAPVESAPTVRWDDKYVLPQSPSIRFLRARDVKTFWRLYLCNAFNV